MLTEKNRNSTPLIEAKAVSFSYDAKHTGRALNSVSFFVDKGERIAILGHNGSGKSTLVKILGGLEAPTEGSCLIKGRDIQTINFRELRSTIGMVFQDPENQIVAAMVEDDIAFAPENQGLPSGEIQARVELALSEANLLKKRNSPVYALSGGEKQRVALAGALAADVECLILDEPTAMIDPAGRVKVEKVLKHLHSEGMTIIQVTHQIGAENFDDIQRVIVLSHGSIIWEGNTSEFWNEAANLGFNMPDEFKAKKYFTDNNIKFPDDLTCIKSKSPPDTRISDMTEKFRIENLSFMYDGKNQVLRKINAEIFKGEWLSVIGRTGSGKSTLIQHLNALFKIQEGNIYFDGKNIPQKGEEVHSLRQKVGLVFQNPEDQLFSPTVRDELAFAPRNAGFRGHELYNAILYGLECVSLDKNFLKRNPIALSGGERRLVAIASVLSAKPECIVLDEPLAGLDASYQKKLLAMLSKLRDEGKTVITISHDLNMALNFSDRILILRDGSVIREGTPHEVLDDIMNILESEAWPDVLRLSAEVRKINPDFPLAYNYEEFISCISQILR